MDLRHYKEDEWANLDRVAKIVCGKSVTQELPLFYQLPSGRGFGNPKAGRKKAVSTKR
jgi:hypothetical protein